MDLAAVKPTVGVVQMTSTPDKQATIAQLTALVERAKKRGAVVSSPSFAFYFYRFSFFIVVIVDMAVVDEKTKQP